jgi:hypothetical protein
MPHKIDKSLQLVQLIGQIRKVARPTPGATACGGTSPACPHALSSNALCIFKPRHIPDTGAAKAKAQEHSRSWALFAADFLITADYSQL